MKLKYLIDTVFTPEISVLDWVDRYAGMTQIVNFQYGSTLEGAKGDIKKYPVSCDVQAKDCNTLSQLSGLVPDDAKKSVVYWEEVSPFKDSGKRRYGQVYFRKFKGVARIICWMNLRKLGSSSCSTPIEAIRELESVLSKAKYKISGGEYDGSFLKTYPVADVPHNINAIFGKYTYDNLKNYYLPPFDFFAIDVCFELETCVKKPANFDPTSPVDCENEIPTP